MTVIKILRVLAVLLAVSVLLSGCVLGTLDELYCLPKRSEEYENLQAVVDKAMAGLEYCAPSYGENRQFMQAADLDGDGIRELIIGAIRGAEEAPLIFELWTLRQDEPQQVLPEAEEEVRAFIQERNDGGISFGNGRGVRNLFEKILVQQANRLATMENVTREDLMELTAADVEAAPAAYRVLKLMPLCLYDP